MKNKKIEKEIDFIVNNIVKKNYQVDRKRNIKELIIKALANEIETKNKCKLLEVIKRTEWFHESDIDIFFNTTILEIFDDINEPLYFICKKEKISSSNFNIITNLIRKGLIEEENIIEYSKEKQSVKSKKIEENAKLLILDDYIGSGKSIIDIIKCIETVYNNKNIIIIAYIWQEKALKKLKEFLNEKELLNYYDIYDKKIRIEFDFREKCIDSKETLEYIRDVCNCCTFKSIKYGFRRTGAMLVIDGVSPNNNISMLWSNDIIYKKTNWIPIFNTELNVEAIKNKKKLILKNSKKELLSFYERFIYKSKYSFEEFKALLLLFNMYSIRIQMVRELLGVDTITEAINIINKFRDDGIIIYETDNSLEFVDDNIIKQFKQFDKEIYYEQSSSHLKKVSSEYI